MSRYAALQKLPATRARAEQIHLVSSSRAIAPASTFVAPTHLHLVPPGARVLRPSRRTRARRMLHTLLNHLPRL